MEISLENRDTERFITDINPDITATVETTKRDPFRDSMLRQCPL
jgi:hypothetical protein